MRIFAGALALACAPGFAQPSGPVQAGAEIYARNCSACHGARMLDPQGAFDLRKFPRDQRERFVASVTKGKNAMPPKGGSAAPDADIKAAVEYMVGQSK